MAKAKVLNNSSHKNGLNRRHKYAVGFIALGIMVFVVAALQTRNLIYDIVDKEFQTLSERISVELKNSTPNVAQRLTFLLYQQDALSLIAKGDAGTLKKRLFEYPEMRNSLIDGMQINTQGEIRLSVAKNITKEHVQLSAFENSLSLRALQLVPGQSLIDVEHQSDGVAYMYVLHRLTPYRKQDLGVFLMVFDISESINLVKSIIAENRPVGFVLLDRYAKVIVDGGKYREAVYKEDRLPAVLAAFGKGDNLLHDDGIWLRQSVAPYRIDNKDTISRNQWQILLYMPSSAIKYRVVSAVAPHFFVVLLALIAVLSVLYLRRVNQGSSEDVADGLSYSLDLFRSIHSAALWSIKIKQKLIMQGNALFASLGYEPKDIDINDINQIMQLIHQDDLQLVRQQYAQMNSQFVDEVDVDVRVKHKLGYWVWQNYRVVVIERDDKGQPKEVVGITIDITKRKQDEKLLASSLWESDRSNRLKTQFIANLSNEVRNPINAVLGFNELLRLTPLSDKQKNYIQQIDDSSQLLLNRFNQVLIFSKLEEGTLELQNMPASVETLVEEVLVTTIKHGKDKIKISSNLDNSLAEWYLIDAQYIKIVLNMLMNAAIGLSEAKELHLDIVNNGRSKKAHMVQFVISVQCAPTHRHLVQDAVQRAQHVETGETVDVINIDLELASKLIDRFGADLNLNLDERGYFHLSFALDLSIPDVYHRLKIHKEHANDVTESEIQQKKHIPEAQKQKVYENVHVLVVDDNATNREVIIQLLKNMNLTMDVAVNGLEATEFAQKNHYDLILMDLQMPVMDGFEATQIIRKAFDEETLPIVAVTANQFNIDREHALAVGMNDFIPKPVSADDLIKCVNYWVLRNITQESEKPATKQQLVFAANEKESVKTATVPELAIVKVEEKPVLELDSEASLVRLTGDKNMLVNIYLRFREDFKTWFEILENLIASQDWPKAKIHAHTLKGAAANIDANAVSKIAAKLELLFHKPDNIDNELVSLMAELSEKLPSLFVLLDKFLDENVVKTDKEPIVSDMDIDHAELFAELHALLSKRKRISTDKMQALTGVCESIGCQDLAQVFSEKTNAFDFSGAIEVLQQIELQASDEIL